MTAKLGTSQHLVYGVYRGDELVFMPEQEAIDKAKVWQALYSAKTWGEFRQAVPARFYEEVVEILNIVSEDPAVDPEPDEQAPFDSEMIPGHADGDWPSWPAQEMLDWVPADVQQRFGKRESTRLNGDYLRFQAMDEATIVAKIQAHGYTCTHDVALVKAANGWAEPMQDR